MKRNNIIFPKVNFSLDYRQYVSPVDARKFIVEVGDYVTKQYNTTFNLFNREDQPISKVHMWSPDKKRYSSPVNFNINFLLDTSNRSYVDNFKTENGMVEGVSLQCIYECVKSIFHECRHLEQYNYILSGSKKDDVLDFVLFSNIAESSCFDHYDIIGNYNKSAAEVDAQIMGSYNAYLFCKSCISEVDWLDIMKYNVSKDKHFDIYFDFINSSKYNVGTDLDKIKLTFKLSMLDSLLRYDDTYNDVDRYPYLTKSLLYKSFVDKISDRFKSIINIPSKSIVNSIKDISFKNANMLVCDSIRSDHVLIKFNKYLRVEDHILADFDKIVEVKDNLVELSNLRYKLQHSRFDDNKNQYKLLYDKFLKNFDINYDFIKYDDNIRVSDILMDFDIYVSNNNFNDDFDLE